MTTPATAAQIEGGAGLRSDAAGPVIGSDKPRSSPTVAMDLVAFADMISVAMGALLPAYVYSLISGPATSLAMVVQAGLIAGFITQMWMRNAGMYDLEKISDLPNHPLHLLSGIAVGVAAVIGFAMPVIALHGHITVWFGAWIIASFTLVLLVRGVARSILTRMAAAGRFDRSIAVYGAGSISRRVHDHFAKTRSGIRFVGVYDDRTGEDRVNAEGLTVSGELDDLLRDATAGKIDDIVIALPQSADSRIAAIVRRLEQAPSNIHVVTHIATDLVSTRDRHRVSQIGNVGLIDVKDKPLADWAPIVKRAEDLLVAAVGLVLALPILLAAVTAIKLDGSGPVLYRQRRRGLNGQVFDVLKLRTLTVTDSDDQVRQVTAGDDRVTRVGRILRRTSIDELPQLWNVLRGDMSIVGPRPHALIHDEKFSSMLEDYANRHQVKPGITGLAQVNGLRGETRTHDSIRERVDHDMAYIRAWSLSLDLKIIARTLFVVFTGKNAH